LLELKAKQFACAPWRTLRVEAHAALDERSPRTLAEARGRAVYGELTKAGLPTDKLDLKIEGTNDVHRDVIGVPETCRVNGLETGAFVVVEVLPSTIGAEAPCGCEEKVQSAYEARQR
jgi:hypothetical protein